MNKIYFDADAFYNLLKTENLSARKLGDPEGPCYIGWSTRSITRSARKGYMSEGLYYAIMNVIDISSIVVYKMTDDDYEIFSRIRNLEIKIKGLESRIESLENELKLLHAL